MEAWSRILDRRHLMECTVNSISQAIVRIILDELEGAPEVIEVPALPVTADREERREEKASRYGFGGILRRKSRF